MREREIQRKLEHIWNQRLTPGIQSEEIHNHIKETKKGLEELTRINTPTATIIKDDITQKIRYAYDNIIRSLTKPNDNTKTKGFLLRNHFNDIRMRLEDLLLQENQPIYTKRRVIIPQNNQVTGTKFKYIPFSYQEGDLQEITEINAYLKSIHKDSFIEKTYQLIPRITSSEESLWNIELIGGDKAQQRTKGNNALIGVIDTGIDYNHQELADRFTQNKGYNFIYNNVDPFDDNGHGTHVAGTIAGNKTGVATESTLLALKMLNAEGFGREVDFIRACEYAIDNNIDVLNASLGSSGRSFAEEAICDIIRENNILLIAAAGNDGTSTPNYPASYNSVMSIAAVDKEKIRAPFSQTNKYLNLAAPGVDIYSTTPHNNHKIYSGTSMATPHVTGSAALIISTGANSEQTRELLEATAEEIGIPTEYGSGLVRPDKALQIEGLFRRWAA